MISEVAMKSHIRIDGIERVSGKAKYTSDTEMPNMLFGRVVMSLHAHAHVEIDTSQAEKYEGVKAVVTSKDGLVKWSAGDMLNERYAITDRPRFVGDIIGAVAADNRASAEKGAELVSVEYKDLPAVFDPKEALLSNAPKLWPKGNTQDIVRINRGGNFDGGEVIVSSTYRTSRTHPAPMETISVLASWEDSNLTLFTQSQGISNCRSDISNDLGIPLENVRVICRYKGGGFGNKNCAMNYDIIAALLSKKAGKPVLLEYSRYEDFLGHHTRWSTEQEYKLRMAKSGLIRSLEIATLCDIGAYGRHPTGTYVEGPDRLYPIPNFKLTVTPAYTNNPPTGNVRGPTEVQSYFALESAVDEAANKVRMDPLAFRLANLGQPPLYRTTSNGLEECIRRGAELFRWRETWNPPSKSAPIEGTKRGVGMALGDYESSVGRGEAELKLNLDGTVDLAVGVTDIGTGAKTTMAIIASEALGISVDNINVVWGDTSLCPFSIGESGSRTTSLTGPAVSAAAQELISKLKSEAAMSLQSDAREVQYEQGRFFASSGSRNQLTLGELAGRLESPIASRGATDISLPDGLRRYSYCAHFVEVEVDTDTGKIAILRYVAAHDSGKIVNKLTAESQIRGGIIMGLSTCLAEKYEVDRYGNILTSDLWTYHIQRMNGVPTIDVLFVETDDPFGPKTLGETSVLGVSPAVGNAVFNAVGSRLYELPFTPDYVYRTIHNGA
jgi:CO/xanthine dehydrogenase Mo-binding subunit